MRRIQDCYICGREFRTSDALGLHHEEYHKPRVKIDGKLVPVGSKVTFDIADISEADISRVQTVSGLTAEEFNGLLAGLPSKG